ncbi:MAG: hypothetical protein JWN47_641 [Frankiales bacterium]|nr:hypothetical protein [Frankiales bacterium]
MPVEPGRVHESHPHGGTLAGPEAAGEQPVRPAGGDGPDLVLDPVVVRRQIAVIEVTRQRRLAVQAVVDGLGGARAVGYLLPLQRQPLAERIGDGSGLELSDPSSLVRVEVVHLALDFIQLYEVFERLLGHLALVVGPDSKKLRRACARQPASVTPMVSSSL